MSEADRTGSSRVTLEDVARRAGVSRALVSIVMREAPGASAETRARVLEASRDLGYRPDLRARALAGQKSGLLGVMFGVDVGSFHFDLLEGLYAAAETQGLSIILSPLTRNRDEHKAAQTLQDFRFDAVIMLGPPTAKPVLAGQVPTVVVGWSVDHPMVDVVRTSDAAGMAVAVQHLVDQGHRRIAHIDGGDSLIAESRRQGYIAAMTTLGLAGEIWIVPGGATQIDGHRAALRLLAEPTRPSAVITYNDDTAVALMTAMNEHAVDVPAQLSVIGWDDSELAGTAPVGLTSVVQDTDEIARLAVERVIDRLRGRRITAREIVLTPALRERSSTIRLQ